MRSLVSAVQTSGWLKTTIRGTGISPSYVRGRWQAGETYEELAEDYRVSVESIIAAVHYELGRLERHQGKAWREATRRDE